MFLRSSCPSGLSVVYYYEHCSSSSSYRTASSSCHWPAGPPGPTHPLSYNLSSTASGSLSANDAGGSTRRQTERLMLCERGCTGRQRVGGRSHGRANEVDTGRRRRLRGWRLQLEVGRSGGVLWLREAKAARVWRGVLYVPIGCRCTHRMAAIGTLVDLLSQCARLGFLLCLWWGWGKGKVQ